MIVIFDILLIAIILCFVVHNTGKNPHWRKYEAARASINFFSTLILIAINTAFILMIVYWLMINLISVWDATAASVRGARSIYGCRDRIVHRTTWKKSCLKSFESWLGMLIYMLCCSKDTKSDQLSSTFFFSFCLFLIGWFWFFILISLYNCEGRISFWKTAFYSINRAIQWGNRFNFMCEMYNISQWPC